MSVEIAIAPGRGIVSVVAALLLQMPLRLSCDGRLVRGVPVCAEAHCERIDSCSPVVKSRAIFVCIRHATAAHPSVALSCGYSTTSTAGFFSMEGLDEISPTGTPAHFDSICLVMYFSAFHVL